MATAEEFMACVHSLDMIPLGTDVVPCLIKPLRRLRKAARPLLHPMCCAIMENNVMPVLDEGFYRFVPEIKF